MADYRRPIAFGISIVPAAATLDEARTLARRADATGLDLIGIQGPPLPVAVPGHLGADRGAARRTAHVRCFPNVANLPLRNPAMIAKQQHLIDAGAAEAERDPTRIRRIYNLMGRITDAPASRLLEGPPPHWIEELTRFVTDLGFDTFVFWPNEDPVRQVERFAAEVVPGVREQVARARR